MRKLLLVMLTFGAISQLSDYVPRRGDYTFKTRVCVKYDPEMGETLYDTIITYLTDARGHTDTLMSWAMPLDTNSYSRVVFGEIVEEDWNFDGYPDLQVCLGPFNSQGNEVYDVFFWNESQHRFVRNKSVEDTIIFSPRVNESEKTIVSVWRLDGEMEVKKFRWEGDNLVEFSHESFNEDEEE